MLAEPKWSSGTSSLQVSWSSFLLRHHRATHSGRGSFKDGWQLKQLTGAELLYCVNKLLLVSAQMFIVCLLASKVRRVTDADAAKETTTLTSCLPTYEERLSCRRLSKNKPEKTTLPGFPQKTPQTFQNTSKRCPSRISSTPHASANLTKVWLWIL